MKKTISFLTIVLAITMLLSSCGGYTEDEKREVAKRKIKDDIHTAIAVDVMLKYGYSDVDISILKMEKDENTTITVNEGNVEPVAYKVRGTYEFGGEYLAAFEGVYGVIFFSNSKEVQLVRQSLTY